MNRALELYDRFGGADIIVKAPQLKIREKRISSSRGSMPLGHRCPLPEPEGHQRAVDQGLPVGSLVQERPSRQDRPRGGEAMKLGQALMELREKDHLIGVFQELLGHLESIQENEGQIPIHNSTEEFVDAGVHRRGTYSPGRAHRYPECGAEEDPGLECGRWQQG